MTPEKVALGEALFHDERLSSSGDIACATCHQAERAFTEDRARSLAQDEVEHTRNAPTLINTGYLTSYGWANNVLRTLERHAPVPLFGEAPVEIGLDDEGLDYAARTYGADLEDIVQALASYQRSLLAFDSAWDTGTLDEREARGELVFEDHGCTACHRPPLFTDADELNFHDNLVTSEAAGLLGVTFDDADRGHFKTPTLRKVRLTSPYMHDGRFATLEDVVDAYNERRALDLDEDERADLLAFLRAL